MTSTTPITGDPTPTHDARSAPLSLPPVTAGVRADIGFLVRWLLLGAASGGLAGLLVGGVGGRLAMFVLRLTSPDLVVGVQSDDGFTIGRFSTATIFLLLVTASIGAMGGIAYVALRGFLPPRSRLAVWALTCGTVGGSIILHADGVDFRLLEPTWLATALFVAIPAGGGALTAYLVDRWSAWWWTQRRTSLVALLPALPLVFVAPMLAALAATVIVVALAGRLRVLRAGAGASWSQALALGTAGLIVALAGSALVDDLRAIL